MKQIILKNLKKIKKNKKIRKNKKFRNLKILLNEVTKLSNDRIKQKQGIKVVKKPQKTKKNFKNVSVFFLYVPLLYVFKCVMLF